MPRLQRLVWIEARTHDVRGVSNMIVHHNLDAAHIALSLPKGRRIGPDKYIACCIAHDDKNPSLSFTQKGDRVLFHCFAGCSQGEVIDALRSRGLWPESKKETPPSNVHVLTDKADMQCFCWGHEKYLKLGIPTTTTDKRLYMQYKRVLYSPFTPGEIVDMHMFCLAYSFDVKRGETPTPEEDSKFMTFQKVMYEKGVPYAW